VLDHPRHPAIHTQVIDGKAFAARLNEQTRAGVAALIADGGPQPGLAVVLVSDDPASNMYVRNKGRQSREAGMLSFEHRLPVDTPEAEVLGLVERLNSDPAVHGILVQLPLPAHIGSAKVIAAIDPEKDVDGFHVINAGRLAVGAEGIIPCTPLGCLLLLREQLGPLKGLNAVVLGRSNIVGKPMAQLLLRENCTVTIAHSGTRNLAEVCRSADILVVAVGRPEMVRGSWVKPGATVIDVGINRVLDQSGRPRLVGDVAYAEALGIAGQITPVPGGVGPMTIACLLRNTLAATCRRAGQVVGN